MPAAPISAAFQSTRPRGARRDLHRRPPQVRAVSIHAPTRGATTHERTDERTTSSFNPRAHAGRDARAPPRPAWGARFNPRAHAGRDSSRANAVVWDAWFQSTRPRGARQLHSARPPTLKVFQSTRPRGARRRGCVPSRPTTTFQSTRPRGARPPRSRRQSSRRAFQSTRPRGARRRSTAHRPTGRRFNPRAHAGRDAGRMGAGDGRRLVSIHAPTRGATSGTNRMQRLRQVSIHAPTRGATHARVARLEGRTCFNPRAHAGRDPRHPPASARSCRFQSTRPRGARLARDVRLLDLELVSIHAPTRGATASA